MREIIEDIKKWQQSGKLVAIATTVKANGSSMRPLGSKMAVTPDKQIAGSVTGGCIEGAVYEEAQEVIRGGAPKLLHYGVASDQTPWEIGLSCGSSLTVLVESLQSPQVQELYPVLVQAVEQKELLACITVIGGELLGAKLLVWQDGRTLGSLGDKALNDAATQAVQAQFTSGDSTNVVLKSAGQEVEVFIDVLLPPARLIIVGAVHIAIPLVALAKTMGFTTIVIDPRKVMANRERFPDADELLIEWPNEALERLQPDQGTFVTAVSHDEKLDDPALAVALKSDAKYVGVLGNRRHIPVRLDILREMGVSEEQLKKLHAPIGLDLGAVQPEEIALSVLAEMIAVRHGRMSGKVQPKPMK